jgi:hypothetical protein
MCRAGGRRCPNAGGRSTQNTRQAVSRARKALREARETGNPVRIAAARERLTAARTAHRQAKDDAVNQHHEHQDHEHRDHAAAQPVTPDRTGDETAGPVQGNTDGPESTQDAVVISVRVQGTCPAGHLVFHNLPVNAVKGSHGFATATTDCPSCGGLVSLSGSYGNTHVTADQSRDVTTPVSRHHHNGGQDHAADHHDTPRHSGDVTPRTTPDDDATSSSTRHTSHMWANDRGERVTVNNTVNGHADGLIQTAVVSGNVDFTAGQGGGITTPVGRNTGQARSATDDAGTTGFTVHNTNIAHPGAHVGSQHDVHHDTTHVTAPDTGDHHAPAADDSGDVTGDHFRDTLRSAEDILRLVNRQTNRRGRDRDDEDRDDRRATRNVASGNDHVTQQVGFTLPGLRRPRRR